MSADRYFRGLVTLIRQLQFLERTGQRCNGAGRHVILQIAKKYFNVGIILFKGLWQYTFSNASHYR